MGGGGRLNFWYTSLTVVTVKLVLIVHSQMLIF